MIKVKIIKKSFTELDPETGLMVEGFRNETETPIFPLSVYYPTAVAARSDGEFFRIYEEGDVIT